MKKAIFLSSLISASFAAVLYTILLRLSEEDSYKYEAVFPIVSGCFGPVSESVNRSAAKEGYSYRVFKITEPVVGLNQVEGVAILSSNGIPPYELSNFFFGIRKTCYPDTLVEVELTQPGYESLLIELDRIRSENTSSRLLASVEGNKIIFAYRKSQSE